MDTLSIVTLAAKLLTWMRTNVPDEREPSVAGQQVGAALVDLVTAALSSKVVEAADLAALAFASEVLAMYSGHVHAVVYVPTPTEAAKIAADQVRRVVTVALPAEVAEATLTLAR